MSELGSDSVSVLRIISYFDALGESAANADTVVRSAALLAECPVAAQWGVGPIIAYDAHGAPVTVDPRAATGDDPQVWLRREGPPRPLDPVLLDRLRHTLRVAAVQQARARSDPHMGDPTLLEVVLSDKERREDRLRAVGLLGLDPARDIRVLAVSATTNTAALELISRVCPGRMVRSIAAGNLTAVILQDSSDSGELALRLHEAIVARYPAPRDGGDRGPWIGVGERMSVYAAPASWKQARRALRFTSATPYGRRAVAAELLGSLALLAELPVERLLNDPGVARLNAIATSAGGEQEVATLEAFCVFGSLRRTAAELHLHHSTVAARLARLASEMGWNLDDSVDRFMATLVLMVRRLALTSTELAAAEVFGRPG